MALFHFLGACKSRIDKITIYDTWEENKKPLYDGTYSEFTSLIHDMHLTGASVYKWTFEERHLKIWVSIFG
jgi:hypothetical protein